MERLLSSSAVLTYGQVPRADAPRNFPLGVLVAVSDRQCGRRLTVHVQRVWNFPLVLGGSEIRACERSNILTQQGPAPRSLVTSQAGSTLRLCPPGTPPGRLSLPPLSLPLPRDLLLTPQDPARPRPFQAAFPGSPIHLSPPHWAPTRPARGPIPACASYHFPV